MVSKLINVFVERGIIKRDTEVYTYYYGYDVSGIMKTKVKGLFIIDDVRITERGVKFFRGISMRHGEVRTIYPEDIIEIDGMGLKRLAKSYNINYDGTPMNVGKKRGRKPKNVSINSQPKGE